MTVSLTSSTREPVWRSGTLELHLQIRMQFHHYRFKPVRSDQLKLGSTDFQLTTKAVAVVDLSDYRLILSGISTDGKEFQIKKTSPARLLACPANFMPDSVLLLYPNPNNEDEELSATIPVDDYHRLRRFLKEGCHVPLLQMRMAAWHLHRTELASQTLFSFGKINRSNAALPSPLSTNYIISQILARIITYYENNTNKELPASARLLASWKACFGFVSASVSAAITGLLDKTTKTRLSAANLMGLTLLFMKDAVRKARYRVIEAMDHLSIPASYPVNQTLSAFTLVAFRLFSMGSRTFEVSLAISGATYKERIETGETFMFGPGLFWFRIGSFARFKHRFSVAPEEFIRISKWLDQGATEVLMFEANPKFVREDAEQKCLKIHATRCVATDELETLTVEYQDGKQYIFESVILKEFLQFIHEMSRILQSPVGEENLGVLASVSAMRIQYTGAACTQEANLSRLGAVLWGAVDLVAWHLIRGSGNKKTTAAEIRAYIKDTTGVDLPLISEEKAFMAHKNLRTQADLATLADTIDKNLFTGYFTQ